MSLYGSSMAQSLGQGTFIFDKIYPNRYLLDTNKDADGVLIGRYALVEYDRPLAVVKSLPTTYREENGTISRHYDIIKKIVLNTNTNNFEFVDNTFQIFVCKPPASGDDNKYEYHYTAIPGDGQDNFGEWIELGKFTPFEFNSKLDKLYATSDDNNEENEMVYSGYAGWDSTAWIKTVAENNLKYVKVADLNVLTPTFEVGANITPPLEVDDYGNYNFKPPIVKPTEGTPGSFTIQFPTPLDINLIVNDGMGTNSPNDRVTPGYSDDKTTKQFTINIPEIKAADNAAKDAEDNSKAVLKLIQYPMDNGIWPSNGGSTPEIEGNTNLPNDVGAIWKAIKIAKAAGQDGQASIISAIDTDGITVSIGKETDIINNKLNIEVTVESQNLITSSDIQDFWSSIQ